MPVHRSGKPHKRPPRDWGERELLTNLDKLPRVEVGCIVGCGPLGYPLLDKLDFLPPATAVIALNGAVRYPISPDYWLCYDIAALDQKWYPGALPKGCIGLMGKAIADERASFVFEARRRMSDGMLSSDGSLLNGAASPGVAAQLLEKLGAKLIYLHSCEFYGSKNADGSSAGKDKGGVWGQAKWMNRLIAQQEARGVKFLSLTPTYLKVDDAQI
jgi:hypothetical protein